MFCLMSRREALCAMAASLVAAPSLAPNGRAEIPYPAGKTIRIVAPFAPGGLTDGLARIVAQVLAQATNAPFVVDNRTGASGTAAAEIVARSAPDGTTLLMGTVGIAVTNQLFHRHLPYDITSFAPIALVGELANALVVHPTFPARTLQEFIHYCRQRGANRIGFSSPGTGSSGHLAMEYLQSLTGIKLEHVVQSGRSRMMRDLLAGRTLVVMDNLPPYLQYIQSGALRTLGVTSAERWFAAPDVPTISEQLGADFHATFWWYVAAPAGTRLSVVNKLSDEIVKGISSEAISKEIQSAGAAARAGNADELAKHTAAESLKWKSVIDLAKLAR